MKRLETDFCWSIFFTISISDTKVSNLSNLFEDPDSVRDTGRALVLLLNPIPLEYRSLEMNSRDTNERFQTCNRSLFCVFRNLSLVFENRIKSSNLFEDSNTACVGIGH